MQKVLIFLKSILNELLIIFLLIFIINNYIGNVNETIKADGVGYYDYLPSLFIHHDLNRHNLNPGKVPEKFNRISSLSIYVTNKTMPVNKYPCGVAILESPFFMVCRLTTDRSYTTDDGYQTPYQLFIFYAAVFYLFLSIYFLKKLLVLYNCNYTTILVVQLMLVLGTSVTNYVNFDASFSHIYSLFAITTFLYLSKLYFGKRKFRIFYLACVMLGIIILLRPINGMIIFFIPFLAGSYRKLRVEFIYLLHHFMKMSVGILILLSIVFIQCWLWYLQTGYFIVYTYGNEGFNFSKPEIFNVLFSYRKGLFVYTTILLITMSALIWFGIKRRFYELFTWIGFFILITYVISSWWCWYYGGSFGLRAYIDFFAIFFILFAIMYDKLLVWLKVGLLVPALFLVYLNIVQTYQYKEFILHWSEMNKQMYWNVFLKTAEPFKGLVWKRQYDYKNYQQIKQIILGNFSIPAQKDSTLALVHFSDIDNAIMFQVMFSCDFKGDNDSRIAFSVKDVELDKIVYWHERYLLHFNENRLNTYHAGLYNYELPLKLTNREYELKLVVSSRSNSLDMNRTSIKIFSTK